MRGPSLKNSCERLLPKVIRAGYPCSKIPVSSCHPMAWISSRRRSWLWVTRPTQGCSFLPSSASVQKDAFLLLSLWSDGNSVERRALLPGIKDRFQAWKRRLDEHSMGSPGPQDNRRSLYGGKFEGVSRGSFPPSLLVSTWEIFLWHSWTFPVLPARSTFHRRGSQPLVLTSQWVLSLSPPHQWEQMAAPGSRLEAGKMASPFWLSREAMLSQDCHVHKDDAWPLANSFISQLVRTHEGNRAARYWFPTRPLQGDWIHRLYPSSCYCCSVAQLCLILLWPHGL